MKKLSVLLGIIAVFIGTVVVHNTMNRFFRKEL